MNLKASFVSFLRQKYSGLEHNSLNVLITEQLLSPFQIKLSPAQVSQIQNEIQGYWKLREWGVTHFADQYSKTGLNKPNNYSACMSYDFHINEHGQPELIEINTNASFLALGLELYDFLKIPKPVTDFTHASLINMFKEEQSLVKAVNERIAIIDDTPEQQRLFVEFLVYQQMFKTHGLDCDIYDYREIDNFKTYGLIYNRYTDFYLSQPSSAPLRELFNKNLNFSPNSYEYFLLADKQRLIDWNTQNEITKPSSLLPVYDLGLADKEQIWNERKKLFIKPKTSFGSKQVYKAASISHKVFDEVYNENFIAQQLSVPSEIDVVFEDKPLKLKYDLRCFAYKNNLQLIIARLYQGQTTNLKTNGGGFAAVTVS